jgi:hypothetical protein
MELKFFNAPRFKVFLAEMRGDDVERVLFPYLDWKRNGQYFAPYVDPITLHELSLQMTVRKPTIGCRARDILYEAAARLCDATLFVTADKRPTALAKVEGRAVKLISS